MKTITLTEAEATLLVALVASAVIVLPTGTKERSRAAALYVKLSAQTGITIGE